MLKQGISCHFAIWAGLFKDRGEQIDAVVGIGRVGIGVFAKPVSALSLEVLPASARLRWTQHAGCDKSCKLVPPP